MPQVVVAIVGAIGSAVTALSAFAGANALFGAIVKVALSFAVSAAASAIFSPKLKNTFQRQADVLTMQLGETPRVAIFGEAATGGSLADAFNHGTSNEWEVIVVALADHECEALTGFVVGDKKYTFTANGQQAAFNEGSTASLYLYWYPGTASQTASTYLTTNSGGRWTSDDKFTGVSYVVAAYRYSQAVWPQGRPRFRWIVKGAKCYDPRLDSTVDGGSGAHRWDTPSTHTYSDNAQVCEFNWRRGVWSNGQLMVGPGRSPDEAPADAFTLAAMNLCDENVSLKAGGTEKRYRCSAVIMANERWIDTQADFARAMGGDLIDRAGVTQPDPGVAKTAAYTFTDANLIEGARCEFRRWLSRDETVNTVSTRYVEPTKLYQPHSAPLRRNQDDIDEDGEPREAPLELPFVTSNTQAQRVGEMLRRKGRLQRQATVTLGPEFMAHETGDWIDWQSDIYLGGDTVTFEVRRVRYMEDGTIELGLREIAASCFSWTPASDELDETSEGFVAGSTPSGATLSGFALTADSVSNAGAILPAIKCVWDVAEDYGIANVLIEWRKTGTTSPVFSKLSKYRQGKETLAEGLVSGAQFDVRATPKTAPARAETATSWSTVTVGAAVANSVSVGVGSNNVYDGDYRQASGFWSVGSAGTGTSSNSVQTANAIRYEQIVGAGAGANGTQILFAHQQPAYAMQVVAGDRVEVSGYLGGVNLASIQIFVRWYDASGAYVSDSSAASTATGIGAGAGDLSSYTRIGGFVTAPSTARRASVYAIGYNGAAATTLRIAKLFIAKASADQTALTPWSPGFEGEPGADVTLSHTAAAITGQGDLATTNRAALPFGDNVAPNSEFRASGTWPQSGYVAGGRTGAIGTFTNSLVTAGPRRAVKGVTSGSPNSADYMNLWQWDATSDVAKLARYWLPVVAGDRVAASLLVAKNASCSSVYVGLFWLDAAGAYLSEVAGSSVTATANGDTGNPTDYALSSVTATAPTNARFAAILPRAIFNGGASPTAWAMSPMLALVPSSQTAAPAYTPTARDRAGDVTSENTAAAITGQGLWATASSLNVNGGVSGTFSATPLSGVSPTSITVAACTWTGAAGSSVSVPSGTISGLANSTKYFVFRDITGAAFVAVSSFASAIAYYNDATGRYLALGTATTQSSGGTGGGPGTGGGGGVWP